MMASVVIRVSAISNALEQLNLAAKLVAYDFKHRSIIEQRIIDVEQMEEDVRKL